MSTNPTRDFEAELERVIAARVVEAEHRLKDRVVALIRECDAREDARDASIQKFLNEDGDLNEDEYTYSEYDEAADDAAREARDDLASLLNSLRELAGLPAHV
ncbi:hypothetical protein NX794_07780 [Streptomyces sp. LP11]|uniref:Uncharacterized protein n=1 Tax=Streptomyces pyxinicus TaxID=2970331 RepID=A0ABT2AY95_9ACTN|nr:hypothetical protein [Streptomyces sp. LP11]MCS0601130.1 hypothetical protein [Streptomyces sp. LP11]